MYVTTHQHDERKERSWNSFSVNMIQEYFWTNERLYTTSLQLIWVEVFTWSISTSLSMLVSSELNLIRESVTKKDGTWLHQQVNHVTRSLGHKVLCTFFVRQHMAPLLKRKEEPRPALASPACKKKKNLDQYRDRRFLCVRARAKVNSAPAPSQAMRVPSTWLSREQKREGGREQGIRREQHKLYSLTHFCSRQHKAGFF